MSAQPVSQMSTTLRQIVVRYRRRCAVGLLIVAAMLAVYHVTSVPAAPPPRVDRALASLVEPAAQSVIDELRVHGSIQPLPTSAVSVDPAQQSVMSYLRAHESMGQALAPWDPAVQALLDYLRAHSR